MPVDARGTGCLLSIFLRPIDSCAKFNLLTAVQDSIWLLLLPTLICAYVSAVTVFNLFFWVRQLHEGVLLMYNSFDNGMHLNQSFRQHIVYDKWHLIVAIKVVCWSNTRYFFSGIALMFPQVCIYITFLPRARGVSVAVRNVCWTMRIPQFFLKFAESHLLF